MWKRRSLLVAIILVVLLVLYFFVSRDTRVADLREVTLTRPGTVDKLNRPGASSQTNPLREAKVQNGTCGTAPVLSNMQRENIAINAEMRRTAFADSEFQNIYERYTHAWQILNPVISCPITRRLGNYGDGGKFVCISVPELNDDACKCVVYSAGSNNQFDFEAAIHEYAPHCEIHTFDFGAPVKVPSFIQYHQWGIGNTDSGQMKTMATTARELGHTHITLLKLDIEGSEWDVIPHIMQHGPMFDQLQIEYHEPTLQKLHTTEQILEQNNLYPFSREINFRSPHCCEYSYLRVRHE